MSELKVKHLLVSAILLCCTVLDVSQSASRIRVGKDGGYSNIVIKISQHIKSTHCRDIIQNLQVCTMF